MLFQFVIMEIPCQYCPYSPILGGNDMLVTCWIGWKNCWWQLYVEEIYPVKNPRPFHCNLWRPDRDGDFCLEINCCRWSCCWWWWWWWWRQWWWWKRWRGGWWFPIPRLAHIGLIGLTVFLPSPLLPNLTLFSPICTTFSTVPTSRQCPTFHCKPPSPKPSHKHTLSCVYLNQSINLYCSTFLSTFRYLWYLEHD